MNNPSTLRIIMKRFLACFGCAAVLAASVSCTKDTTVTPEVKRGAIEITASVEGTRTSLEGADVRWSANDALGIFSGTKFVNAQFTTTDDNAASATFTGDATDAEGTEAAKAFAYYPYAAGATLEGTTVSGLEIPAEQTFAEGTFATTLNPMAAVGEDHTTLAFRSVGAVLRKAILADETVNPVGDVNTVITAEMLAKVTEIRISTAMDATGLNLDGLELCPNLTTLSINAWQVSLGDIELSGFTKLTDVTMSPTAGYTSIKLPAGIKKFKSVISYTNHEPVGPTTLDLTQYTDLEYVNVMDSYSKPAVLTSLNVSGLSKLALLYVGGTPEVNIANCPLLTTCISNYGTYDSGFYWSGSSSSQTIIVESEAKRDQLKASWKKVMGYDEENPANAWTIQQ